MRCVATILAAAVYLHLAVEPAKAIGDTEAKNCAVAIAGSVDAAQISNVCGVPPELLAVIVEEFKQAKEALQDSNKTLQELADERKGTVENVRQTLDLTNGQIRAAFEILGETNIPAEQLASKLVEIAQNLKELRSIAFVQPGDTPEITSLKQQAQAATEAGEFDEADTLLADIDDKQSQALATLAVNRATTLASRGDLALGRLRYKDAAKYFASAAATLPPSDAYTAKRRAYLGREASAFYQQGEEFGDNLSLQMSIEISESVIQSTPRPELRVEWAEAQNALGLALLSFGVRQGGKVRLARAAAAFRAALEERTREHEPLDWAITQNNLGIALWALGERDSSTANLEQAIAAYHAALQERTRARDPVGWALTQMNLGNALRTLGQRQSEFVNLEEAVTAYRAALEELTRQRSPLDWAKVQLNLGVALWTLGERESGKTHLEELIASFRGALEEWTVERVPIHWASAQSSLGNALWALGEREPGTARLEEAVAAYRAALQEMTRDRVPIDWATTHNNLGGALLAWGERESSVSHIKEAIAAFRTAQEEWTRERVPLRWAMAQNNLGGALASLGSREKDKARVEEAVAVLRSALGEHTRERVPLDWAKAQNNLGIAFMSLAKLDDGKVHLEEAVTAFHAALEEWTRERVPPYWATAQLNLASVLGELARRTTGSERVGHWKAAIESLRNSQQIYTRELEPRQWAAMQNSIGYSLVLIGEQEDDLARFEEAIPILREALVVQLQLQEARSAASTSDSLCHALLGTGSRKKARLELLEAAKLCENAKREIDATGGNSAETSDNLAKIADALKTLP